MTAMPTAERMTAEEYLSRPYDPRGRGWELFDLALELTRAEQLTSPLLPGFELALDAVFG